MIARCGLKAGLQQLDWDTPMSQDEILPPLAVPRWVEVLTGNIVPLVGILFFGWDALLLVLAFWLENAVIGFYNVLKMAGANPAGKAFDEAFISGRKLAREEIAAFKSGAMALKFFLIPFFIVHYGMFMLVHGVFVCVLLGSDGAFPGPMSLDALPERLWSDRYWLALALVGQLIAHGVPFYRDYIRGDAFKRTIVPVQMFAPYGRIVVLHVAILAGAFLLVLTGAPRFMAALLLVLKMGWDALPSQGSVLAAIQRGASRRPEITPDVPPSDL